MLKIAGGGTPEQQLILQLKALINEGGHVIQGMCGYDTMTIWFRENWLKKAVEFAGYRDDGKRYLDYAAEKQDAT
jgi:hypothetical protein